MEDILLTEFFKKERWEAAIETAVEKDISQQLLREMSTPDNRILLYRALKANTYRIRPPHEAQIPKDNGEYRTVYVNEDQDRVILSIINDMLFELCPEMVHKHCMSYQRGIGCGKVVQKASQIIKTMKEKEIGVKVDLSKYFDSVPIRYIEDVFQKIENKFGPSKILDLLNDYYHDNTVIDMEKKTIEKYSSLRQGCAVAAFLADAVLYDMDAALSEMNVFYVRYSDDILVLGKSWKEGYKLLQKKLAEKELTLNPNIQDVWEDIMKFPWKYTGKNANQLIQDKIDRIVERKACDLATIWKADPDEILFHAHHYKVDDDYVDITLNYDAYKADEGELSKLKYLKAARQSIREAVEKDIVPLMSF